jgi:hypothetical protein
MACGDGYVDRDAGEECDPHDPARDFESACETTDRPNGKAACDPKDCTIINTHDQCAVCGDGHVDSGAGEACDGSVPPSALCVDGTPAVECSACRLDYDKCPTCGNGKVDLLEECDPYEALGDITEPIYCSDLDSGFPKPFTYGVTLHCLEDCTYDRATCSFCGDGEVDPQYTPRDEDGPVILAEKCDGDEADPAALELYCRERCTGTVLGSLVFDCNFECAENCLTFVDVPDEELDCCIPPAEACPPEGSDFKCCWELVPENVESGDDPCVDPGGGNQAEQLCR